MIPSQVWRYEDIQRIQYKGRRAVLLPNNVILAKCLNRRRGSVYWTILGRRATL